MSPKSTLPSPLMSPFMMLQSGYAVAYAAGITQRQHERVDVAEIHRPSQFMSPTGYGGGSKAQISTSSMFQPGYVTDASVGPITQRIYTVG